MPFPMSEQLFPINRQDLLLPKGIIQIRPYLYEGVWVFDDAQAGLLRGPFVGGINLMIDRLVADMTDPSKGFRLFFSSEPFERYQVSLTWIRVDAIEGNWYRADDAGDEGWLCPALFCYSPKAPTKIFVRAEAGGSWWMRVRGKNNGQARLQSQYA